MKSFLAPATTLFVVAAASASLAAAGQPSPTSSIERQHEAFLEELSRYAAPDKPTSAAAEKALGLVNSHLEKEEELVVPLLALLPNLSEGRIEVDIDLAVSLADRLKAEREAMFDGNAELMGAVGKLIQDGGIENEQELVDLGGRLADHVMMQIELSEPAAVLVGEVLRQRIE